MRVYVKLGEPLWRATGQRRLALAWPAGAEVTVADVLARLTTDHSAFAAAYAAAPYRLFVDAAPVDAGNLSAGPQLADGQTLFILLPAIGG
ncbi:MAG: hypothetical protein NT169_09800 [Chloroflexi bacterium]|nr:hypothetical protein [Chloroflexota bacterium]